MLSMKLRDVRDAQVKGSRVLVRTDYDVQIDSRGAVRDDYRLKASLPTLQLLIKKGATVIIVAHRGRPIKRDIRYSLKPLQSILSAFLKRPVMFISTGVFSPAFSKTMAKIKPGQVVLLENIRFEPGEGKNADRLAKKLASLADIYVNEAFAEDHRSHASVMAISKYLPSFAGLRVQLEWKHLEPLRHHPGRPFVAILGGAKISTKLPLIRSLLRQADFVLLGGALANTVLRAQGLAVGQSIHEPAMLRIARQLTVTNPKLKIPVDVVVSKGMDGRSSRRQRAVGNIGPLERILDIGPDTIALYSAIIRQAKTIVWNGPMGLYEIPIFAAGTMAMARSIARSSAKSYAGGGETEDAIHRAKVQNKFTFISTGGGAMMEFLQGRRLPGLQPLLRRS